MPNPLASGLTPSSQPRERGLQTRLVASTVLLTGIGFCVLGAWPAPQPGTGAVVNWILLAGGLLLATTGALSHFKPDLVFVADVKRTQSRWLAQMGAASLAIACYLAFFRPYQLAGALLGVLSLFLLFRSFQLWRLGQFAREKGLNLPPAL